MLMSRIRTIKPDAFLSESLSAVPRGTRWTFAGLWTYADDAGRARDDVRLIKAALYPLDDTVTLDDVTDDLDLLWGIGAICRYEVDGRRYLHMPKWGHQKINRPTPPKSPPCPLHEDGPSGHVLDSEDSRSDHGGLTESSTWEKEGKGRERNSSSSADADGDGSTLSDDFADWYDHYPRKVGKQAALKAYRKAHKAVGADVLRAGLARQLPMLREKAEQFRPHPATWLNEGRWEDEPSNVHPLRAVAGRDPLPGEVADDGTILPPLPKGFFDQ